MSPPRRQALPQLLRAHHGTLLFRGGAAVADAICAGCRSPPRPALAFVTAAGLQPEPSHSHRFRAVPAHRGIRAPRGVAAISLLAVVAPAGQLRRILHPAEYPAASDAPFASAAPQTQEEARAWTSRASTRARRRTLRSRHAPEFRRKDRQRPVFRADGPPRLPGLGPWTLICATTSVALPKSPVPRRSLAPRPTPSSPATRPTSSASFSGCAPRNCAGTQPPVAASPAAFSLRNRPRTRRHCRNISAIKATFSKHWLKRDGSDAKYLSH